jgi:hypothetical protein
MVKCRRCGTENPPGSIFCMKCGTRFPFKTQDESPERKSASLLLQKWQSSSPQLKTGAFLLLTAIIIIPTAIYFTGENLCKGVDCGYECSGHDLWKMRCFKGACIKDHIIEANSNQCRYNPPTGSPETSQPSETSQPQRDTDNDGIPDSVDDCLNPGCTLVNDRGCPRDSDGDGLQDCYDDCPGESGEKGNKGCPVEEKITSIKICLVNYNAPGNDNENPNGEWVQICNNGNQDVDMSGWRLYDSAQLRRTVTDHVFIFPSGFILRAGKSVFVYTGVGMNTSTKLYFGRPPDEYAAIWNNTGDCAYLEDDKGNLVDSRCW